MKQYEIFAMMAYIEDKYPEVYAEALRELEIKGD